MGSFIYNIARWMTWFGAAVLAAISVLSVVSIVGRALTSFGLSPVRGDFELVEVGTAIAVFAFLPWAHLKNAHAFVDMLWGKFPAGMQRALMIFFDALMLVVWTLLTWRLFVGMEDFKENGETTFLLGIPVWTAYASCLVLSALGVLVYAWRFLETIGVAKPPVGFVQASGGH